MAQFEQEAGHVLDSEFQGLDQFVVGFSFQGDELVMAVQPLALEPIGTGPAFRIGLDIGAAVGTLTSDLPDFVSAILVHQRTAKNLFANRSHFIRNNSTTGNNPVKADI